MKFVSIKDNLKEAALLVEKNAAKKVTLPILGAILFTAERSKMTLTTTNLETGIEVWIPGKVLEEGRVVVPARVVSSYISLITDDQVTLESSKENLLVVSKQGRTLIKGYPSEDFPILPKIKKDNVFTVSSPAIREALAHVGVAVAVSDIKPEIASIVFAFSPHVLKIAATDSFRLAEKRIEGSFGKDSISLLLPGRAAAELMRLLEVEDGDIEINSAKGQVTFVAKRFQMVSRLTEGSYPDYERIVPTKFSTEVEVEKRGLLEALRIAGLFVGKLNDVSLLIKPSKGLIEVETANTEVGENMSSTSAQIRGEELTIKFNYRYLLDGINQITSDVITLSFTGNSGPVLMRNKGDNSYFYIAMPMKM